MARKNSQPKYLKVPNIATYSKYDIPLITEIFIAIGKRAKKGKSSNLKKGISFIANNTNSSIREVKSLIKTPKGLFTSMVWDECNDGIKKISIENFVNIIEGIRKTLIKMHLSKFFDRINVLDEHYNICSGLSRAEYSGLDLVIFNPEEANRSNHHNNCSEIASEIKMRLNELYERP